MATVEQSAFKSSYLGPANAHGEFCLRMLTGENVRNDGESWWPYSLASALIDLHGGNGRRDKNSMSLPDTGVPPQILFLTATRAAAFGFAIKEFWQQMYPEEKLKMFVVDVSHKRHEHLSEDGQSRVETAWLKSRQRGADIQRLKALGEQYGAFDNAAVFDEYLYMGHTIAKADSLLRSAGYRNVNFMAGQWGNYVDDQERPIRRTFDNFEKLGELVIDVNDDSRAFIADMKLAGRLMAEEAAKHE